MQDNSFEERFRRLEDIIKALDERVSCLTTETARDRKNLLMVAKGYHEEVTDIVNAITDIHDEMRTLQHRTFPGLRQALKKIDEVIKPVGREEPNLPRPRKSPRSK